MDTRALKQRKKKSSTRTQVNKTPLGKAISVFLTKLLCEQCKLVKRNPLKRVWTFILQIRLILRCIDYAVWTQIINLFCSEEEGRIWQALRTTVSVTSARLQHSGVAVIQCSACFFSTHLYTRCNHIWKEPKGKTHNSKQRKGYKCFGSG